MPLGVNLGSSINRVSTVSNLMNHTTDGQEQRKKTTDKIEGNNYPNRKLQNHWMAAVNLSFSFRTLPQDESFGNCLLVPFFPSFLLCDGRVCKRENRLFAKPVNGNRG